MINENIYLELSYVSIWIILIGFIGIILNNKSLIHLLICIELILFGINIYLISLSLMYDDYIYEILVLIIIALAGVESSIGLSIIVLYYKKYHNVKIS